jgi:hypothetical protein
LMGTGTKSLICRDVLLGRTPRTQVVPQVVPMTLRTVVPGAPYGEGSPGYDLPPVLIAWARCAVYPRACARVG